MGQRRFQLDPNLSASENLGLAVRYATPVVLRRYRLGNLDRETLDEVYAEVRLQTYRHFVEVKVLAHKYCRQTKDGKPLTFFDNVISSCWSVTPNVLYRMKRNIEKRYSTISMEAAAFHYDKELKLWDVLPDADYLENDAYVGKFNPLERMENIRKRPGLGLQRLLDEYTDYEVDAILLGVKPITREQWIERNATESEKDSLGRTGLDRREYMRAYQKQRRAKARARRQEEYKQFLSDKEYGGTTGRKK